MRKYRRRSLMEAAAGEIAPKTALKIKEWQAKVRELERVTGHPATDRVMVHGYGRSQAAKVTWAERKVFSGEESQLRAKGTHHKTTEKGVKIISQPLYNRLIRPVLKAGGIVMCGGKDVEAHLDFNGASALQVADVIMFRESATVSDVLEETYHFEQNRKGLNNDKPTDLRTILNEIDAKQYLISVAGKYKIPLEETETTKAQLASYRRMLKEWMDTHESD